MNALILPGFILYTHIKTFFAKFYEYVLLTKGNKVVSKYQTKGKKTKGICTWTHSRLSENKHSRRKECYRNVKISNQLQ